MTSTFRGEVAGCGDVHLNTSSLFGSDSRGNLEGKAGIMEMMS
jgi:hypothetical protein